MHRRAFLSGAALFSTACLFTGRVPEFALIQAGSSKHESVPDLYAMFKNPALNYHPFVRWWWTGNKVEAGELIRELRLLKDAGIGGVEINPIEFPSRFEGDDLGRPSLE